MKKSKGRTMMKKETRRKKDRIKSGWDFEPKKKKKG